jgi:hypothetical protein
MNVPSTGFKELLISSDEKAGILPCSQTKNNLDISQALRYPGKTQQESKYAGKEVLAYDMYCKGGERFSEREHISPNLSTATVRFTIPLAANRYNLFGEYTTSLSLTMDQPVVGTHSRQTII